jgi:CBS domain containing-hemolysin-like protein
MYPFIFLLNGSANLLLKLVGMELQGDHDQAHSVAELKKVLRASHSHGELGRASATLLKRAFDLNELTAGDLMRPDEEMVMLDVRQSLPDILAIVRQYRYSRYPVYEGEPDNVLGILHVKDLIAALDHAQTSVNLRELVKPALIINSNRSALGILRNFQQGVSHFAIVGDEYGNIEGFVTLDHVVEVLTGNIPDEFSHRKPDWAPQADGSFVGHGSLSIYSLERLLNVEVAAFPDVNSVGGLLMDKLERIPEPGDRAVFDGFELEVKEMDGPRITTVVARPVDWQEYEDQTG